MPQLRRFQCARSLKGPWVATYAGTGASFGGLQGNARLCREADYAARLAALGGENQRFFLRGRVARRRLDVHFQVRKLLKVKVSAYPKHCLGKAGDTGSSPVGRTSFSPEAERGEVCDLASVAGECPSESPYRVEATEPRETALQELGPPVPTTPQPHN